MKTKISILGFLLLSAVAPRASAGAGLRADSSSQTIQNQRADADHLSRMEDDAMVQRWARLALLDPVPPKTGSYYLYQVRPSGRYLRPWSKLFLTRLSEQFRRRFGKPLRVTSLLRTARYQSLLRRKNGNAAAAVGPKRSSHLTGASLDISKKGMSAAQREWLRRVLTTLRSKGCLYAVEEYQQPVFHVMVYRSYEDYVARRMARSR